jgi:hypothetical protein
MTITRDPAPPEQSDSGRRRQGRPSVEANARLTGSTAAVLFVLLAAEGFTILHVRSLLSAHVFIGLLLVPPVLLKIGTTSYRFVRYYLGSPEYRRKGPPPPLLRLLGPFLVVLTLVVLGSGIALLLVPPSQRSPLLLLHKASFVLWLGAMAIHVLGHLVDTTKLAPQDWLHRTRRDVSGAGLRQWVLVSSVAAGVLLGFLLLGQVRPWLLSSASHRVTPFSSPPTASPSTSGSRPSSATSSSVPPGSTTTPPTAAPIPVATVPSAPTSTVSPVTTPPPPAKGHGHHRTRKKTKH